MALIQSIYNCNSTGTPAAKRKIVKTKRVRKVAAARVPQVRTPEPELVAAGRQAMNKAGIGLPSTVNHKGVDHERID